MNDYNAGQITRLYAGGQFIAATGITGAVNARTQSNYTAGGLSQNGAVHKTKATPKDRQWLRTKQAQDNRNCTTTPAPNVCPVAGGGDYSCSLGFRRCSDFSLRSHASSTHAEKLAPGFSSFSRSTLASTFSIMPCGKRIPLYIVLLFIWLFVIPHPIDCLNKSKDTPGNHSVKLFKQISLICLNTLFNLFKHLEIIRLVQTAKPRSAPTLARLLTTNDNRSIKVAMKNHTTQSQIVYLPYVAAVDPADSAFVQAMYHTEQSLLTRVKAALDEAGVAWIDPRTKERSQPTTNAEGSDNAQ